MAESALTLDAVELFRGGLLAHGSRMRSVISRLGMAGMTAASVPYESDMMNSGESRLRLRFSTFAKQRRSAAGRSAGHASRDASRLRRWAILVRGRWPARSAAAPTAKCDQFGLRLSTKNAPQIRHTNV
jgi:hypothetical protein